MKRSLSRTRGSKAASRQTHSGVVIELYRRLIDESDKETSHPVVCVMKKDGTLRLCVDFRA